MDGRRRGDIPLVGRTREIELVGDALRRADLSGVVLVGPAGIGKTRLLTECVDHAVAQGFRAVRVAASRATVDLPLGALAPIFADATDDGVETLVTARQALVERAGGRPLIVAVDDAHLLDDTSAALLHQAATDLLAFVVCTMRSGELPPEPVTALWKDQLAARVDVAPFDASGTADMAVALLGGPVRPTLAAELHERTEGNALFLREVVTGSQSSGVLSFVDGAWTRDGELTTPQTLVDLVGARVAHLDELAARALGFVALAEPCSVSTLERLVDPERLAELEEQGLVVVSDDERRLVVRLAHPMYGDVIRRGMSRLRARRMMVELATAVSATGMRRRDDVLRVAGWLLDAGEPADPSMLRDAAREARRRHDDELAERLAAAAYDLDPSTAGAIQLGLAQHGLGRHAEAIAVLEGVEPGDDPLERARLDVARANVRFWGLGDLDGAVDVLERAIAASGAAGATNPPDADHPDADHPNEATDVLVAALAVIRASSGQVDAALELAMPMISAGTTGLAGAYAVLAAAEALDVGGRPEEALRLSELALSAAPTGAGSSLLHRTRLMALMDSGQVLAAEARLIDDWALATRDGDLGHRAFMALALAWVQLNRGRLPAAVHWVDESAALYRAAGQRYGQRWALGGALVLATHRGDLERARQLVDELDELGTHPAVLHDVYERGGRAWLLAISGQEAAARDSLLDAAQQSSAAGRHGHAVRYLFDVARLGDAATANEHLQPLRDHLDGSFHLAVLDGVAAMAAGDAQGLLELSAAMESFGAVVFAAEAATLATDAFARAGDQRAATAARHRAMQLLTTIDGATTPALVVVDTPVPLTRREREVARLVSGGRSSREVAEMLYLSVRTVESHLARVYDKLGVRSREELAKVISAEVVA